MLPSGGIILPVPILTRVLLRYLHICAHTKFQSNNTQTGDRTGCAVDKAYMPTTRCIKTATTTFHICLRYYIVYITEVFNHVKIFFSNNILRGDTAILICMRWSVSFWISPYHGFSFTAIRHVSLWILHTPSFWYFQFLAETAQNGRTVLLIVNLIADAESGSPDSHSSFLVTIHLSQFWRYLHVTDRRVSDNADHLVTCWNIDQKTKQGLIALSEFKLGINRTCSSARMSSVPSSVNLGCATNLWTSWV